MRPARAARPHAGRVGRFILPGILAAAAAVVIVIAIGQLGGATSSARVEREEVTAASGVVQSTITGTGNLEPVTDEDVDFQTSGTLSHVDVTQGEHVHKGQLLATLDDTTAALTLKEARATLAQARTTLTTDEDTLDGDSSDASATVYADTTEFAAYSPQSAATATGAQPTTASTTSTTRTTPATGTTPTTGTASTRTTTPVTGTTPATAGSSTATVTETVTAPASTASSAGGSASGADTGGSSTSSAASGSSASSGSSAATVTAATIDSDRLTVVQDEATVAQDETALRETRLRAPVSGTITTLESLQPGDSVSSGSDASASTDTTSSSADSTAGSSAASGADSADSSTSDSSSSSAFAVIDSLRHLSMTVSFTESDISELKVGQSATVSLDALSGVELAAKVTAVSSIGTTSNDVVSYDATLTLKQRDARVKPGMSASATVIVKQGHGVTVPSGAVTGTGTLATVKKLVGGHTRTHKVIVGIRGDSRDLIVSGVKAGDTLVETQTLPAEGSSAASTATTSSGASRTLGGGLSGGFGGGGFSGTPPSGAGGLP